MRALPAIVALAVSACVTGGGVHPVESVTLHGNETFGDGEIVDRLATRPPHGWPIKTREDLDVVALQVDADRIETFYRDHGYFDAKVTDVKTVFTPSGAAEVDITIEEGAVTKLAAIRITGADEAIARAAIAEMDVELKVGDEWSDEVYEATKLVLVAEFRKRSYAHVRLSGAVAVDREAHTAALDFTLDLGPPARFGKTKVEGLARIHEGTVQARVAWDEGGAFDPALIERTEGRLFALGVFSSARVAYTRRGRPEVVDLTIHIQEATTHEVRAGFGVAVDSTHLEVHLRGGYTVHGVFDEPLLTFRTDVTPGWSWLRAEPFTSGPSIQTVAALEKEDFFFYNLHGTLLGAFDRTPRIGYTLTGPRTQVGVSYPFGGDDFKLSVAWHLQYLIYADFDPSVFTKESTSSWLGYYQQALVLDKRDFPLDAHRGWFAQLELLEGGPPAGGQVGFMRVTPEVRGYIEVFHRLVLSARARYGRLITSGTNDAPLPVRYLGGGANDHRGFGFQRLSPQRRDQADHLIPIGGSEMVLGSVELRMEIFRLWANWLSFAVFSDVGDVTAPGALDLGNLHYAAGFGLRYNTVVGPIRADIGFRLNRLADAEAYGRDNPDPGSGFVFHISIGEAF